MESKIGRVALGIVAVGAAVVLLVVLSSSDDSGDDDTGRVASATKPAEDGGPNGGAKAGGNGEAGDGGESTMPTIVVRGGKPVGGVEELDFDAGGEVRFAVRSDMPEEVHVHGYDVEKPLPPNRTVRIEFPASIEGIFEAELHGSGEQIAELRINP